jgi:hypothetical protein
MKHFDLNIDKILENWELCHAVRELLSNAIDEQILTGTAAPEIFQDSAGWWHIRDYGRGLRYQDLIQSENPEKIGHSHLIGNSASASRMRWPRLNEEGFTFCFAQATATSAWSE